MAHSCGVRRPFLAGLLIVWRGPSEGVWHGLGEAALVAGVVGFPSDLLARRAFQADAFEASFGYLLADPLRGELNAILQLGPVCVDHTTSLQFAEAGSGFVRVTIREDRTFQNVTTGRVTFRPALHLADWHFHGVEPLVEWMRWNGKDVERTTELGDYSLVATAKQELSIPAGNRGRDGSYPESSRPGDFPGEPGDRARSPESASSSWALARVWPKTTREASARAKCQKPPKP
jgi:hypothetical protein